MRAGLRLHGGPAFRLKRTCLKWSQVLVGEMPRGWWRARELGKTYYRSLNELIKEKRQESEEEMV